MSRFTCLLVMCLALVLPAITLSASEMGSIDGNAQLVSQPADYTVLVLPSNYQSDPVSMDLVNGFNGANSTLVSLRNSSKLVCYLESDPDYQNRFAKLMPQESAGKPAVLVEHAGQKLYYNYGA